MEQRNTCTDVYLETRADGRKVIRGLASPYYNGTPGTEFHAYDNVYERFMPGSFDEWLSEERDIVGLFNHDKKEVLGRTPNTLKVWTSQRGLEYEIDPPETRAAQDLLVSIERRDIRGASIGFKAKKVQWRREGDKEIREIHKGSLHDVSVVTDPAYSATQAYLITTEEKRSIETERTEHFARMETERRLARWNEIEKSITK